MSDCNKIHPLLPLDVDGGLSPAEKQLVDKHLQECAAARHEMDQLNRLRLDLRNIPEPQIPHDLHSKIMGRLANDEIPLPIRPKFWARYSWVLAVAAVLVFIILNPFSSTKETLRGPVATRSSEQKLAMNTQSQTEKKADANYLNQKPSGLSLADGISNKQFAMAKKVKSIRKKQEPASVAQLGGYAGPSNSVGFDANIPSTIVLALKPAAKDNLETNFSLKQSESLEVPAPAAAPPAMGNLAFAKVKKTKAEIPEESKRASSLASLPAEPSSNASLGPQTTTMSWSGANGSSKVENQEVLSDSKSFQNYWQALQPGKSLPVVDFTKQSAVLLMAGEKPTTGYSISITQLEETADQLIVHYQVSSPSAGATVAQILTSPWAMQIIPKPSKPVSFLED